MLSKQQILDLSLPVINHARGEGSQRLGIYGLVKNMTYRHTERQKQYKNETENNPAYCFVARWDWCNIKFCYLLDTMAV